MDDKPEIPKLFTIEEAERTRLVIEPLLGQAIEHRRVALDFERRLTQLAQRIMLAGGLSLRRDHALSLRQGLDSASENARSVIARIESTGCKVKDIDTGLIDFPGRLNGEDVFWCWRLGESRIRFWHRLDEGFAGRKPISPADPGATPPVQ